MSSSALVKEFKAFALKGNVLDLAVGVIIGGAFGKIVSSLVNDIIMPPFGFILQGIDFKNLQWILRENADGSPGVALRYGNFLQNLIEFLIVGFSIFLLVKTINRLRNAFYKQEQEEKTPPPTPPEDIQLLREIRDALKKG